MNPWIGFLIQLAGFLIAIGAFYGAVRIKLDNLIDGQKEVAKDIKDLTKASVNSQISEQRQLLINEKFSEDIERINDRLDVYGEGLKKVENTMLRMSPRSEGGC